MLELLVSSWWRCCETFPRWSPASSGAGLEVPLHSPISSCSPSASSSSAHHAFPTVVACISSGTISQIKFFLSKCERMQCSHGGKPLTPVPAMNEIEAPAIPLLLSLITVNPSLEHKVQTPKAQKQRKPNCTELSLFIASVSWNLT